jgi:hypothetical protein
METTNIAKEIAALPPEAQKQIVDFLAFIKTRYASVAPTQMTRQYKLAKDPFIGMWRTRTDLQDSATWVRNLRQKEWERSK